MRDPDGSTEIEKCGSFSISDEKLTTFRLKSELSGMERSSRARRQQQNNGTRVSNVS